MDAIDLQLALGRAPGLTAAQLSDALTILGSGSHPAPLRALFEASSATLSRIRMPAAARLALLSPDRARIDADREWLLREPAQLLDATSPRYPLRLAQIVDAPALLYVRGDLAVLQTPQLAIAGSRNPTPPGLRAAREFAACLSREGLTITSGLALGIDAASHQGALDGSGRTVAVLGNGLDQIYPPENRALAQRLLERGAIVSEYPPGTGPLRHHFPQRNRIISGLSLGVLVVEAAQRSGSLGTAGFAGEQGREVFAIPGSIHNPLTRGCHALIRGGATLVEKVTDILQELQFPAPKQALMEFCDERAQPQSAARTLDKGYKILLDALGFEAVSLDLLTERTGLPSQSVASMLLILELDGAVGIQAGGLYVRLFKSDHG